MILNEQQIKDITFGALGVTFDGGVYHFKRMTDSQAAEFIRENPGFEPKTRATSGVRFDFYTDSDYIDIQIKDVISASSRNWYSFDLFVNGKIHTYLYRSDCKQSSGRIYAALESGQKRIQLYFPSLANGSIASVELADGAAVTPAAPEYRWLALGDSITQGYDAQYTSNTYVNRVAAALDASVVNQAIGGAQFYKEQIEYTGEYDIVSVAYGVNDWNGKGSEKEFCDDCDGYLEKLAATYPNAKKFVILPIYYGHWYQKRRVGGSFFTARRLITQIAEKYGFIVLETIDYLPHNEIFYADLVLHPNDAGFYAYAVNLEKDIRKYL